MIMNASNDELELSEPDQESADECNDSNEKSMNSKIIFPIAC